MSKKKTAPEQENQYMEPEEKAAEENKTEPEKAAQNDKEEYYKDLAMRTQADFDNYRKRNVSVRADALAEGAADAVKAFLPVIDNIDRAIKSAKEESSVLEGLKLVRKQIDDTLKSLGAEEVGKAGEQFDPNLHEAVMQSPCAEGQKDGEIIEVFQKGYRLKDKVLRYTMVHVAQK